jgi:DNA polymerase-3 subunit alpha
LSGFIGKDLSFGGIVVGVRKGVTKKNKPFGIVKMEDYSGQGELALFGKDWSEYQNYFNEGNALFVSGSVQTPPWDPSRFEFKIGGVEFLADVKEKDIMKLTISAKVEDLDDVTCNDLLECLQSHQGKSTLYFNLFDENTEGHLNLKASTISVDVCSEVIRFLDNSPELHYQIN